MIEIKEDVMKKLEEIVNEENKFYKGTNLDFVFTKESFVENLILEYYDGMKGILR